MSNRKKDITFTLGVFIILISCLVIIGWISGNAILKSILPGQVAMKFNTAVCFGLMGISLAVINNKKARPLLVICSLLVILTGTLTIFEYIFNWNAGIDELFWKTGDTIQNGVPPGRPSLPASINFILLGFVFLNNKRGGNFFCWVLLWFVFLSAVFSFLGYLFGLPYFNSVPGLSQMALHTTILFTLLSFGIYFTDRDEYQLIAFRKKVVAGFMLIMLVMATVLNIYNRNDEYFKNTSKWIQHTNEVLHRSEEAIYNVAILESGVRAFLITNDNRFLDSLETKKRTSFFNSELLKILTDDNPPQRQRAHTLGLLIAERFRQFDRSIKARKQNEYNTQQAFFLVTEGTATMGRIHTLISDIQHEEKELLDKRKEDNRYSINSVRRVIFFFGFVMFVILFVLLVVIVRNINARINAEREAVQLNETLEKRVVERTDKLLKAESDIAQREKRFRAIIESSNDLISLLDKDIKPVYRSPAAERITGFTLNEMQNRGGMSEQIHPDDVEHFSAAWQRCMETPELPINVIFRSKHKKGHYIWLEGSFTNMLNDVSLEAVIINLQDISLRKHSEEQLALSERTYRLIASSIPGSVICLLDRDRRYFLLEGDMLQKLGYFKEQLLGKTLEEVLSPERYKTVLPFFDRVFNGETFMMDENRPGYDTMSRFVALKDENGYVYAAMVVVFDISELKNAQRSLDELNHQLENRITERTTQLATANKELESFSYSVSHDLRAPLRGIDGWSLALIEDYGAQLDERAHQYLARVRNETQRMGELIDDMLKLSQVSRTEIKLVDVNISEVVNEVVERMKIENRERDFAFTIQQGLHVTGDANLLEIMFTNLFSNACKFTAKVSPSKIEFGTMLVDDKQGFFIKDNGVGFDMENAKKLFGAFQRMHRQSEFPGTGIGLATVQRIVNLHHGRVWAEAAINQGATFYFTIS